jgi:hypothetical protein
MGASHGADAGATGCPPQDRLRLLGRCKNGDGRKLRWVVRYSRGRFASGVPRRPFVARTTKAGALCLCEPVLASSPSSAADSPMPLRGTKISRSPASTAPPPHALGELDVRLERGRLQKIRRQSSALAAKTRRPSRMRDVSDSMIANSRKNAACHRIQDLFNTVGRYLPLTTSNNERLPVAAAHSNAAVPVAVASSHRRNGACLFAANRAMGSRRAGRASPVCESNYSAGDNLADPWQEKM